MGRCGRLCVLSIRQSPVRSQVIHGPLAPREPPVLAKRMREGANSLVCARVAKTKTAPREAELLRCAAVPQLLTAGARGSASRESRFSLFSQPRGQVLPTGAWANQCDSLPPGASGCAEDAGAPSPALKVTLLCSPLFQGGAPDPGQSELARTSPQPPLQAASCPRHGPSCLSRPGKKVPQGFLEQTRASPR